MGLGLKRIAGVAAACAVMLGIGSGARGQWDQYAPQFRSTQLEEAAKTLGLDDEQREIARSLHEAYLAQHQAAVQEMQAYMEEVQRIAQSDGNWEIWRETGEVWLDFQKYTRATRDRFVNDLKMMLSPEQTAGWERFDRGLRREQEMGQNYYLGFISGAKVDVVKVVEGLGLDASSRAALDESLNAYEIELDRVLVETRAFIDEWEGKAREMEDMEENAAQFAEVYTKGLELVGGIRDINKRHADRIESLLPEDERGEFRRAFNAEAYPAIYRESGTERLLERAMGLEDLRDDQKERLTMIQEQYEKELRSANERWAEATVRWESERTILSWQGGEDEPEWLNAAKEIREGLDERTSEKIRGVLSGEQLAKMPGAGGSAVERPVFGD